jgi:hypothetical protein
MGASGFRSCDCRLITAYDGATREVIAAMAEHLLTVRSEKSCVHLAAIRAELSV